METFLNTIAIAFGVVLLTFSIAGMFVFFEEEDKTNAWEFLILMIVLFLVSLGLLFLSTGRLYTNSVEYNKNLVRPCVQEYYKPVNEMRYDCYKIFENTRGVREIVEELKNE